MVSNGASGVWWFKWLVRLGDEVDAACVRAAAFLLASVFACFLPAFVLIITGVWPPTAMVQEVFTTNFMIWDLIHIPSPQLFFPVGYAQIVLFSYPSSIINEAVFRHASLYDQFQSFGLVWHLWSGTLLFGALALTLTVGLRWMERGLLLIIPLSFDLLLRTQNLGVWMSYDRGEALALLALAVPLLFWYSHGRTPRTREAALCGAVIAFATGIKLTFGLLLLPFALTMFLLAPLRLWWRLALAFAAAFSAMACLVYEGFFLGNSNVEEFWRQQYPLFIAGRALAQREGTLIQAFHKFLSPGSWYFSLQCFLLVVAACAILLMFTRPTRRHFILFIATAAAVSAEAHILSIRLAYSAMYEVVSLAVLLGIVSIAALYHSRMRRIAQVAVLAVGTIILTAPLLYDYGSAFTVMAENSAEGRAFEEAISRAHLPVVYYYQGHPQQLVFPDPGIMLSLLLPDICDSPRKIMQKVLLDHRFSCPPADGLKAGAHVAVIPEYLKVTPFAPNSIPVFGRFSDFDRMRAKSDCRTFNFKEPQPSRYPTHYYYYTNRVTVCIVSPS